MAAKPLTMDELKVLLADFLIQCRALEIENARLNEAIEKVTGKIEAAV